MSKINSQVWDHVVFQEYSLNLAKPEENLCYDSYPYIDALVTGN